MSVFYNCLIGIQTVIRNTDVSGISDDHVIVRKLPWVRGAELPAVVISPISDAMKRVNNQQIEVGYGCHVCIVRASNHHLTQYHDAFLYWREQIEDALVANKLAAVSGVINLIIEPSGLILPQAFRKQYDVSSFVARCIARETA